MINLFSDGHVHAVAGLNSRERRTSVRLCDMKGAENL